MKRTQKEQILEWLSKGGKLTSLDALDLFGCNRLAARISELRQEDCDIKVEYIGITNRYGESTRIAEYSYPQVTNRLSTSGVMG